MKKIVIFLVIGVLLLATIGTMGCTSESSSDEPVSTPAPTKTVSTPAPTVKPDSATLGERNAEAKAKQYLRLMAFSREGLIDQLEYEGFSHQEAVYGVDRSDADWNEQAAAKAKQYLRLMAFSRDGLKDQLEFDGFTPQQAEYGVQAVGY